MVDLLKCSRGVFYPHWSLEINGCIKDDFISSTVVLVLFEIEKIWARHFFSTSVVLSWAITFFNAMMEIIGTRTLKLRPRGSRIQVPRNLKHSTTTEVPKSDLVKSSVYLTFYGIFFLSHCEAHKLKFLSNVIFGAAAYQLGNTSSRTITEVKQRWARLVLGWATVQVLPECCC